MRKGIEVSVDRLKEIYQELIRQGAHNIDLVTPTHYTHAIFQSLRDPLPSPSSTTAAATKASTQSLS